MAQFEIDLALMAGRAYQSTRDQNGINWFPAPAGWTEFSHVLNTTGQTTGGFEAGAFQKGSDIGKEKMGTFYILGRREGVGVR